MTLLQTVSSNCIAFHVGKKEAHTAEVKALA